MSCRSKESGARQTSKHPFNNESVWFGKPHRCAALAKHPKQDRCLACLEVFGPR
jgi:hypothetical protein